MNNKDNSAAKNPGKPASPDTGGGSKAHPLDGYTVKSNDKQDDEKSPYYKSAAPSISLPKGGGALKGIDEKFTVNAVNGTASLQVALPLTPGRNGFTPSLSLQYNSGGGNSEFGLGWGLGLPAIQRKTDKKLPRYNDGGESDVFLLAGAEDLVPKLKYTGSAWVGEETTSGSYHIKRYIPRIEGLFARIEFIKKAGATGSWWRVTTKDNIVTYYGLTANGRISDPNNPNRVFKWLPQFSCDNKGNVQQYTYISEDLQQVPQVAHERNRNNGLALFTNKYLKSVKYCNADPYYIPPGTHYEPVLLPGTDVFWMEAVLDYSDHDMNEPLPVRDNTQWPYRKDAFSDFHAGFEIRTYRKCRRVLMFHFFRELDTTLTINPCLVRSLDMEYQNDNITDEYTEADLVTSITQSGYKKITGGYFKKSLPAMTMDYQPLEWNTEMVSVSPEDTANAPQGLTGPYQWIDLWGEGLPGILTEQANGWFYKNNKGGGHFTAAVRVAEKPSLQGLGSSLQWQDIDADGRRQLVSTDPSLPGFYELDDDQDWRPFRAFKKWANVNWNSPYTKMLDMDGDGRADLLLTEDRAWTWYENKGKEGYDIGGAAQPWLDEEKGPRLVLNDQLQSIFLADMNGDGLTDIVRIKNGEVCYWPNMGYGRFGRKIAMTNAPHLHAQDNFNPLYITLADISGTGAPDLIYLGKNKCTAWINLAGNAFSDAMEISPLPGIDNYSKIAVLDFLGNGTGCIVWSSPLPQHAHAPLRYIDLMGGKKPYILRTYRNGMGKTTSLLYKNSTKYYLQDKLNGTPWATRLPFPVQCLEKVVTADRVSETRYIQQYSYHHGYYDHEEREFRGFGRVETTDTDTAVIDDTNELDQATVLTKTWYHTGAWMRESKLLTKFAEEYYQPIGTGMPQQAEFPEGLNAQGLREAHRALKGSLLRQEVYALDGTSDEDKPYVVTAAAYCIKEVQPLERNRHASFYLYQQHNISWHTERKTEDPRILHELTVAVDEYGNVLEAAKIAYPRATPAGDIAEVDTEQSKMLVTYTVTDYATVTGSGGAVHDVDTATDYRLRMPYQATSYELGWLDLQTDFWLPGDLKDQFDLTTTLDFTTAFATSQPPNAERRLLSCSRILYRDDSIATGSVPDILDLGEYDALGMQHEQYQLAFTNGILTHSGWYNNKVTTAMLDEGGYRRHGTVIGFPSGDPASWVWLPGGTVAYDSVPAATFYMPFTFIDPWGNETTITYWDNTQENYYLLPKDVTDAKGNVSAVEAYDWRCLQPQRMLDPNLNVSEILYDALSMPVATAVKGKDNPMNPEGDTLDNIDPEDSADIALQGAFWEDPYANAADLLQGATWRCIYDLSAQPTAVAMIAREQHYADNPTSPTLIRISYSDGFGRVAMHKAQATNDPITNDERWIGSGKTVHNNKGTVVMQYEPYYSATHLYDTAEQAAAAGVSPRMHYDPIGRVIRTDMPDGSYTKTEWDAWKQVSYDNNDTVLDSDWYTANNGASTEQTDAAAKAANHDGTPTIVHLDIMARPFYTEQVNRVAPSWTDIPYGSYVDLDISGNRIAVHDARGLTPLQYSYNLLNAVTKQISTDSGIQYMITDAAGQPLYAWDADNRQFHISYDELRRPLTKEMTINSITKVLEVMVYGEGETNDITNNLRGQLYRSYDGAGAQTAPSYDFKGNPNSTVRIFTVDHTQHPDWTTVGSVAMEGTGYTTISIEDALGRPVSITTPDNGTTSYTYDKAGALYSVDISGVHSLTTDIVNSILYNAKGQRTKIQYGNSSTTTYEYDPYTFRVTRVRTTRSSDSAILQDLLYWYDPVGNITIQQDDAQQTVYYNGSVVSPDNDYTYDALYRLIIAGGREHEGNNGAVNKSDSSRIGITPAQISPSDTAKMRRYTQYYEYDETGNILEMQHTVTGGTGNWTRSFTIDSISNRLSSSSIGSNNPTSETYTYDNRGNMTSGMNHLSGMTYNAENRLEKVDITATLIAYYQYDSSGQRVRKVLENTGSSITEIRKYVEDWEVYTKKVSSTVTIERETLHIMDDTARIAIVDTEIISGPQLLRYQYSNHLGTACLELDNNANIVSYEEYYPFGSTSFQSGRSLAEVSLKRYRYTGKERDEETGLYYNDNRYYPPWLARWIAVDIKESKYAGASPYNYSFCNPIALKDTNGMDPTPPGGGDTTKTTPAAKEGFGYSDKKGGDFKFVEKTDQIKDETSFWANFDKTSQVADFWGSEAADDKYNYHKDGTKTAKKKSAEAQKKQEDWTNEDLKNNWEKKQTSEAPQEASEEGSGNSSNKNEESSQIPSMPTSPVSTINGIVRDRYVKEANKLKPLWKPSDPTAKSNEVGVRKRYEIKVKSRSQTVGGFKTILDKLEGPVEQKGVLNQAGKVRRFWYTNPTWNFLSKTGKYMGILGIVLSGVRIATAENPAKEAAIVGGGFATAWGAMAAAGPIIGSVSALNPILGGVLLIGVGIAAGLYGEKAVRKFVNFFKW